jgi:ribonuclease HII
MVVGIDEVGRGCWAGPVTAGAVVLKRRSIPGLRDSKQLTKLAREELEPKIKKEAAAWGIGWAGPDEIDKLGMTAALQLAMQRALEQIKVDYSEIVIDGGLNFLKDNPKARSLAKADLFFQAVSAASIIAKVARDRYMAEQAANFPVYGFDSHVGYGTLVHQAALRLHGPCDLHRLSFRPLKALAA